VRGDSIRGRIRRGRGRERECKLGKEVLSGSSKAFLKVERDAPALLVLDSSFHQGRTTNDNSLDCRTCTDGSAKRRSLEERSILGVTFITDGRHNKYTNLYN